MSSSELPNSYADKIQAPLFSTHESGANLTYQWRVEQLTRLHRMVRDRRQIFLQALAEDLGRHPTESICAEIIPVEAEVQLMLKNLKAWMKPEYVSTPMFMFPARAWMESKPLQPPGVLVIGPCNYPLQLCLKPLAGVLAGGNPCVIKPSEIAPNTAKALYNCLREYFEPSAVQVILGSVLETEALLAKPWAKVLFTGSGRVGRLVALACANTLTPCILECGGKSATVVDATVPTSKLQSVADRIVFAKFFNAGQACVAPDTLFVHENHMKPLTAALIRSIEAQFGKDPQSGDMARIVNQDSAQRLVEILKEVEESKGSTASKFGSQDTAHEDTKILFGGSEASDVHQRYVPPTIVQNPWLFSRIMKEEIFGPILPICTFSNRDEVIQRIQQLNKATGIPLFLYVFTTSERVFQIFMDRCLSGGAVRNDILIQLANPEQPLGGLGGSGYGRYFGKYSFDSFTHKYPVTYRPLGTTWDFGNMRCHPYIGSKAYLLQDFLFYLPMVPSFLSPSRIFLLVVLAVAIFPLQGIALTTDIVATIKLWLAAKLEHLATALRN